MRFLTSCLLATLAFPFTALHSAELETTLVSAKRTEEKTSGGRSISAVENTAETQAVHISEVLSRVPATWISRGNGQESLISIRSPVFTGPGSCAEFLVTEDNLPVRPPAFCNVNQLFDVNFEQAERIEVLRGPGTVVHGAGAVHGVINVISPDFTEDPFGAVSLDYGTNGYGKVALDYRQQDWMIQGNAIHDSGYKHDSGFDQQKVRFKAQQESELWQFTHNISATNLEQETATYVVGSNAYKDSDRKRENPNPEAYRNAWSFRYSVDLEHQPNENSNLLITPYIRANGMDFMLHFLPGNPVEESQQIGGGLQSIFIRPYRDNVQLISGFDLDITAGSTRQYQKSAAGPIFPAGEHYNYDATVYTAAWFAEAEINLDDIWLLTIGARLANSWYDYHNNLSVGSACDPSISNCRYYRPASDMLSFFNWQPEFTAQYQYVQNHFSYLTLVRGYRPPHTAELFRLEQGQQIAGIKSVIANSVEWGFKGTVNPILSYHLSLYYMKKNNVIVKTADRQQVDGQRTQHQGAELTFNINLSDIFLIDVGMAYAEHRYDSNVQVFNSGTGNIKGNWIDTAPNFIGSMQLTWLADINTELQLDINHLGPYYLDAENNFRYSGHTLFNVFYQQQLPGNWALRLGLINATNEDYADRADITVITPVNPVAQERYFIGEPRNVRIGISKTF
ncbi:Vitamin B12 transporter BtuB [BD1-7 clade bacterium]|uniref:Vitamin B12 transporter BtuB n=1 Tax=BD1-7 clade bacterium TaxID=2029982 RepID=A0A5S9QYR4_9GAMM|nr:Vitamin B12 transporter BtuB [BD1-7 clade bacterium]